MLANFFESENQMVPTGMQVTKAKQWRRPIKPTLKFNWDATVNTNLNVTRLGGIMRDLEGWCIWFSIAVFVML